MKNTSLKKINEFIGMYDMRDAIDEYGTSKSLSDVLTVRGCTDDEPADRYVGGQVVHKGYQVNHQIGEDENIYVCKTLNDAAHCVNCIIFNLPIDASRTGAVT
jgi:hypothetical protein